MKTVVAIEHPSSPTLCSPTNSGSTEPIPPPNPEISAILPTPQSTSDVSLHYIMPSVPHLSIPRCDDGDVPQARRPVHSLCILSDCPGRVAAGLFAPKLDDHITDSVPSEILDTSRMDDVYANAATSSITSNLVPPSQNNFFPAMPLPPCRRTPTIEQTPDSTQPRSFPPIILSHTIDISLIRNVHPRDAEWDSFETNHRAGMLPGYINIPFRGRSVRPNGAIIPMDPPSVFSGRQLCYVPRQVSLLNNALPIEHRCVQRPEVYYATPMKVVANSSGGLTPALGPPLPPTIHVVQQARVKASIAAANQLAHDRRKTMYPNTPIPPVPCFIPADAICPHDGLPGSAYPRALPDVGGCLISQWVSSTVYDVNRSLLASVSEPKLVINPVGAIPHEGCYLPDLSGDQDAALTLPAPVADIHLAEGLTSPNKSATDLRAISGFVRNEETRDIYRSNGSPMRTSGRYFVTG